MITIKIAGSNTAKWLATAFAQGRRECQIQGVDFKAAHILVTTPERGRCFEKLAGADTFTAHG